MSNFTGPPRNLSDWLPNLIGPLNLQSDGGDFTVRRKTINFIGATVADNPDEERTDITVGAGGGSPTLAIDNNTTGNVDGAPTTSSGTPVEVIRFLGAAPNLRSLVNGSSRETPLYLLAVGGPLIITNDYSGAPGTDKIETGEGDITIPQGSGTALFYDHTSTTWRLVGGSTTAPAAPDKSLQVRTNASTFGPLEGFTREASGRLNILTSGFITFGATGDTYPASGLIRVSSETLPKTVIAVEGNEGTTFKAVANTAAGLQLGDLGYNNNLFGDTLEIQGTTAVVLNGGSSGVSFTGGSGTTFATNVSGDTTKHWDSVYLTTFTGWWNPALTFKYTVVASAIVAARNITLPLLAADDTFAMLAATQTFSNKTLDSSCSIAALGLTGIVTQAHGGFGSDVSASTGIPKFVAGALSFLTAPAGAIVGTTDAQTLTNKTILGSQGASIAIAALSIDWSLGNVFTKTLAAGANTFTFANAADGQTIVVRVTGAASTLTWPTVKWPGGVAPTQTASGIDIYTFVKEGATIYGSVVQAMA